MIVLLNVVIWPSSVVLLSQTEQLGLFFVSSASPSSERRADAQAWLVFTSDASTSTSSNIRALISSWKRGWRKHKHRRMRKHKDQNKNKTISLCLSFCLRSFALCENETQHKHKEFAMSGQLKHLLQIPGVWAFEQNGGCLGWFWSLCRRSFSLSISYLCLRR